MIVLWIGYPSKQQNIPGFFCHRQKHGIRQENESKVAQYIVKAGGINKILSHIIVSIRCSLALIVFILFSVPSSYSVALTWNWKGS